jgi:outer membrane receptor for ferrienterochelin and colicins
MLLGRALLAIAALLGVAATALDARAQRPAPGAAHGRVVGGDGRAIADAEVVITGAAQRRSSRSDRAGAWRIDSLDAGRHSVVIRKDGYVASRSFVDVVPGDSVVIETRLERSLTALDAIVVTAARREQRLADVPVETELITRADIERTGATDLGTVLVERTGVEVDGGTPAGAGVQMRGFDSRRVLVLIDGQPLTGRVAGHFDLSRLPASMVERVEIVKGPQSTLYGSEALGGVVNVITRRADRAGVRGELSATGGTNGRRDLSAGIGVRHEAVAVTADASHRGVDLAPGVASERDTYARRSHGSGTVRWSASPFTTVEAAGLAIVEDQRYRSGQLYQFADNAQYGARLTSTLIRGAHRISPTLWLSRFEHLSRTSTRDVPASDSGASDVQQLEEMELVYTGEWSAVTLDAGLEARRERIHAERVRAPTNTLSSIEPFAQATLRRGVLSLVPGVRVTRSDRWGTFTAPRLAVLVRPSSAWAVRASVGRGYRAPDFKELYLDFVNTAAGYAVRGNPDLRPESSTSYSLGTEWIGGRAFARATAFSNAYRSFIETGEQDVSGTFTYANLARGHTRGAEGDVGMGLGDGRVELGYTYVRSRDARTATPLLGTPRHAARGSLSIPLVGGVRATASARYTGTTPVQRGIDGGISRERGAWTRVDLRLARPLREQVTLMLAADNVFDRELGAEWPGFTGRQLFVGVTWRQE